MAIMREQSGRGGDHSLSIPKVERDLPAVWAKSLIDIFAKLGTTNALEGLCSACAGSLYLCKTPQGRI